MTERCSKKIWSNSAFGGHPCDRKATVERHGEWFCWQHDPEYVKKKKAERETAWNQKREQRRAAMEQQKIERARAKACVAFFHGRDIQTERIDEGGFWKMVDLLQAVARHEGPFDRDPQQFAKNVIEDHAEKAGALLIKLGIEP